MTKIRFMIGALASALMLSGCGTYTPLLALENNPDSTAILVNKVVNRVKCELRDGFIAAMKRDLDNAAMQSDHRRRLQWLESWGAEISLTLSVNEKSALAPNAQYTAPLFGAETFGIGGGLNIGADATRTEKADFYLSFRNFIDRFGEYPNRPLSCVEEDGFQITGKLHLQDIFHDLTFPFLIPENVTDRPPKAISRPC